MKKLILICILHLGFISFALKFNDTKYWYDMKYLPKIVKYLNPGDVVILTPASGLIKTGHGLLVNKEKKLIDFPDINIGFRESIPNALTHEKRQFAVLRYKYMTTQMSDKMLEYAYNNYLNNQYMITFETEIKQDYTYCTLFIYNVFNKFIDDPDKKIPLFSHIIFPVDFIGFGETFNILNFDDILKK